MSKRSERKAGKSLLRCAPVRLMSAITESELVSEKTLVERAGFLIEIVAKLAEEALKAHWNQADLDLYLTEGQPAFAYKAMGVTFGWPGLSRPDFYAPSRMGYMALEAAGPTLRSSDLRRQILDALINETDLPAKADAVSVRNLNRALGKYKKREGKAATSFFELEPQAPKVARQALLAATDEQFCELSQSEIALLLPIVPAPVFKDDGETAPRHPQGLRRCPERRSGRRLLPPSPSMRSTPIGMW
jgi:hypothetical protein